MNQEYIIINKTTIQKRIDELEQSEHLKSKWVHDNDRDKIQIQISLLNQILSQSSPAPELEKTWNAARETIMVGTPPFDGITVKYKTLDDYLKTQ